MEDEGDDDVEVNHVAKRARYNKNSVVVFDNVDRTEYLSGFRKRKKKRREAGQQQILYKERQKRLQVRREKREALRDAKIEQSGQEGGQTEDESQDVKDEFDEAGAKDVSGTATYDDTETTTVVRVTTIRSDEENDDGEEMRCLKHQASLRKAGPHSGASKQSKLKPEKIKFKKPKKVQSEKRMKKLTRREKSMPKNLRSKRDKKRKK